MGKVVLLSAEVKAWPQYVDAIMKFPWYAVAMMVVFAVGFAQGKSVHHRKATRQSKAFARAETLKMLMNRMRAESPVEVTTPTPEPEAATDAPTTPFTATDAPTVPNVTAEETVTVFTPEQVEEINALELASCGEDGIAGAFMRAFQEVPKLPEPLECPDYEDYIWNLVAEDPFVLCLMEPSHLRIGLECIRRFMEESPVPVLYQTDAEIMQYFNNTEEQTKEKINVQERPFLFGRSEYDPTTEEIPALDNLEMAMCGEGGLGAAFIAAFQPELEQEMPEELPCPAYDSYTWKFVAEDPLTMCLMDPLHLRIGVSCIYKYMEWSPVPQLYAFINDVMHYVEPAEDDDTHSSITEYSTKFDDWFWGSSRKQSRNSAKFSSMTKESRGLLALAQQALQDQGTTKESRHPLLALAQQALQDQDTTKESRHPLLALAQQALLEG